MMSRLTWILTKMSVMVYKAERANNQETQIGFLMIFVVWSEQQYTRRRSDRTPRYSSKLNL